MQSKLAKAAAISVCLVGTLLTLWWTAGPALLEGFRETRLETTEVSMGKIPAGNVRRQVGVMPGNIKSYMEEPAESTFVTSADSRHVAYAYTDEEDDKTFVVVDGVRDNKHDGIWPPQVYAIPKNPSVVFSPDGRRAAYWAERAGKGIVVTDGTGGKEYERLGVPVFSADSKHLGYVASLGGKSFVVVDGVDGKGYAAIGKFNQRQRATGSVFLANGTAEEFDESAACPVFSPDGKRIAYAAQRGNKWLAVVDGREGNEYDEIWASSLVFSPNSRRLVYAARRGDKWLAVLDGVEGKEYDHIEGGSLVLLVSKGGLSFRPTAHLVFSPNSEHLGYVAERGDHKLVVMDGAEGREYEGIGESDCTFSNRRVQCGSDGTDDISDVVFSPDSKSFAYEARHGQRRFVVVNGVEGKEYDHIGKGKFVFSSDSKHSAYSALEDGKALMVRDGVEDREYDSLGAPVFAPDSKHLAYVASLGGKSFVVVDGVERKRYDVIGTGTLVYSPDSKWLAYAAGHVGHMLIVVDGATEQQWHESDFFNGLAFDHPRRLHALVKRDKEVFLVQVDLVTGFRGLGKTR